MLDYNDGDSEKRMGKALADGYRKRVFLMTEIDGRTRKAAREQLQQSLQRLKCLRYALSLPTSVVICGTDSRTSRLREAVELGDESDEQGSPTPAEV